MTEQQDTGQHDNGHQGPGEYVTRELTSEGPRRISKDYRGGASKRARAVTVNLKESPLGWLYAHGHLTEPQYEAGERLRADWERAQIAPSITMRWDPVRIGGTNPDRGLDPSERQIAAKSRFDKAVKAAGPGLADILWRVVCAGEAVGIAEKAMGWPARSGKLVLGMALDRVADFYRLS